MKYSKHGYKRNSKDVNNPYNVIGSGNITMEGVDFPVMGIDNFGNQELMMPGANYTFPGTSVFEVPLQNFPRHFQQGGQLPKAQNGFGSPLINTLINPIGSIHNYGLDKVKNKIADNINPYSYDEPFQRLYDAIFTTENKKSAYSTADDEETERRDLLHMLMGLDQENNSIPQQNQYTPTKGHKEGDVYYNSPVTETEIKHHLSKVGKNKKETFFLDKNFGREEEDRWTDEELEEFWISQQNQSLDSDIYDRLIYGENDDDVNDIYNGKEITMYKSQVEKNPDKYIHFKDTPQYDNFLKSDGYDKWAKNKNIKRENSIEYPDAESLMTRKNEEFDWIDGGFYGGVLGNFTLNQGEDEQGKYFSYYDKWDLDPFQGDGYWKEALSNFAQESVLGVKPTSLYNRMYYTQDDQGNYKFNDGGSLLKFQGDVNSSETKSKATVFLGDDYGDYGDDMFEFDFKRMEPDLIKKYGEGNYQVVRAADIQNEMNNVLNSGKTLVDFSPDEYKRLRDLRDNRSDFLVNQQYEIYKNNFPDSPLSKYNTVNEMFENHAELSAKEQSQRHDDYMAYTLTPHYSNAFIDDDEYIQHRDNLSDYSLKKDEYDKQQNAFKSLSSEDKLKYYKTYFENMGEGSDIYMLKHGDNMFLSNAGTLSEGTRMDFDYGNTPGMIDTFTEAMTAWGPATTGTCYMGVCNGLPGAAHITNETGMTTKAQKGNWAGYYNRSGTYGNDQTFDEQFFNPLNTDANKSGGPYNTYTKEADRIKVLSTPMDYPTPYNPYFLEGSDSSKWEDHWNKALGGSIPKFQDIGEVDNITAQEKAMEEFKYNNWSRADGTVEPKTLYEKFPDKLQRIEKSVDDYLGNPSYTAMYKFPGADNTQDAKRHAYAAALTADKVGFGAANLLGLAHEFGTSNMGSEHVQDIGNNFIGSLVGSVPFTDQEDHLKMTEWLSDNGWLFGDYQYGGSLPKAQFGLEPIPSVQDQAFNQTQNVRYQQDIQQFQLNQLKDLEELNDWDFKDKYNTSKHAIKMSISPEYATTYQGRGDIGGGIANNISQFTGNNPNSQWISGASNQTNASPKQKQAAQDYAQHWIGAGIPIPGLEAINLTSKGMKVPGIIGAPTTAAYNYLKNVNPLGRNSKLARELSETLDTAPLGNTTSKVDEKIIPFEKTNSEKLHKVSGKDIKESLDNEAFVNQAKIFNSPDKLPLTRVLDSKGLTIKDGKLFSKTGDNYFSPEFTSSRNTTHWSYGHIGDPGHGSWSNKSTAIVNDFDNLKKSGHAMDLDPTDTYFYTKGNFEIPSNSLILTRDKKLYNKIKKESNITNIKLFENTTNDEFEAIVNSYSTKGPGKYNYQGDLFNQYIHKNWEQGIDVAQYKPARYLDFSKSKGIKDHFGGGSSKMHSVDPTFNIESIGGLGYRKNHGLYSQIETWPGMRDFGKGIGSLDAMLEFPKPMQIFEMDKFLRLYKNKPEALKIQKQLAEMNGFKSYKEFKNSVDMTNFKKYGGSLPRAQFGLKRHLKAINDQFGYNSWDEFEDSKLGKFVGARDMRDNSEFFMGTVGKHFGYEPDEGVDLALDATAIVNPTADFVHAGTKFDEGEYLDAGLYAGFGILPFGAGPLVRGTKKHIINPIKNLFKSAPTPRGTALNKYGQIKTTFDDQLDVVNKSGYNEVVRQGKIPSRNGYFDINVRGDHSIPNNPWNVQISSPAGPNDGFMQLVRSNKGVYHLDMSMPNRMDAGQSIKYLSEYVPKGAIIQTAPNGSLSLDSYKLLTNQIKRGKFTHIPSDRTVQLNMMSKDMAKIDVNNAGMVTKIEADKIVKDVNKMLDNAGIKQRATATNVSENAKDYLNYTQSGPQSLENFLTWKVDIPELPIEVNFKGGGETNDCQTCGQLQKAQNGGDLIVPLQEEGKSQEIDAFGYKGYFDFNQEPINMGDDQDGHKGYLFVYTEGPTAGGSYWRPLENKYSGTRWEKSGQVEEYNAYFTNPNLIDEHWDKGSAVALKIREAVKNNVLYSELPEYLKDVNTWRTISPNRDLEKELEELDKKQDGNEVAVSFDDLEKGIRHIESLNGTLMKNKQSSASGFYGDLFNNLDYDGTRDEFIADTTFQKNHFIQRYNGEIEDVPGLESNGIDIYNEYKDQVDFTHTPTQIAALSNMLGRQGTRQYFGDVLRDGKTLEEVFPHLYGANRQLGADGKPLENKTPEQYISSFTEAISKKVGGEFNNKVKRLKQQLEKYNKGGVISPLAYQDLVKLKMIKPNIFIMQDGGGITKEPYIIKKGDNLSTIASDNGLSLSEILKYNPRYTNDPSSIGVGETIKFSDAPVQNNQTPNIIHTIASGDTLYGIGEKFGVDYQDIIKLNNISNPKMIQPGQKIRLPDNAKINKNNKHIKEQNKQAESVYVPEVSEIDLNTSNVINEPWAKRIKDISTGKWTTTGKRQKINSINKMNQSDIIIEAMNDIEGGNSKKIDYTIQKGDMLGALANKYGVSVQTLKDDNDISNPRTIQPGQKITINKSAGKPYIIVDEKAGRMHLYYPGNSEPFESYPIVTGSNPGDQQTKTVESFFKDGVQIDGKQLQKIMDENNFTEAGQVTSLPGYTSSVNWDAGNKSTGAGVYTIGTVNSNSGYIDESGQGRKAPSFVLLDAAGNAPGTVIHSTPNWSKEMKGRRDALKTGETSGDDGRFTNGCINGTCSTMIDLYQNEDIGEGTQVFILPEDEGNNFFYENGKINFYTKHSNDEAAEKYMAVGPDGKPGTADDVEMDNALGLNETPSSKAGNYKPINIEFDKTFFQTNSKRFDGDVVGEEKEFTDNTKPFIQSLTDNKKTMMNKLGMDGDTYNDLAMIAFGIYGYESGMGDENNPVENLFKYGAKGGAQVIDYVTGKIDDLHSYEGLKIPKIGSVTSPDVESKFNTYGVNDLDNSIGWTQLRWDSVDPIEKRALNKLGINQDNYKEYAMDPSKVAELTIGRLYAMHQKTLSAIARRNKKRTTNSLTDYEVQKYGVDKETYDPFNYLPKQWSPTSPGYTDFVNEYTKYITLTETDINDVDNGLIIKGEYSEDNPGFRERMRNRPPLERMINTDETLKYKAADVKDTIDDVSEWWNDLDLNPFWKLGGEFGMRNQVQFYNDYINGLYKNTKQEKNANKIYDKLNRLYYNDSKQNNMHQLDIMKSIQSKG